MPLKHARQPQNGDTATQFIELLKTLLLLRIGPETYVFTDGSGQSIDQSEFARGFQGALRVLEIRPRRFYNTRHTYISVALTLGCNQKDRGANRNEHRHDSRELWQVHPG